MGKGSGYGKVILFGEHFVVHGVPGIVSAIDSSTDAEVKKAAKGLNVKDDRKTAKGYGEEKRLQQIESIERMLKAMKLDPKTPLDIWIGGTLPGFSGLGASAASSVAIARAISEELNLGLTNEQINAVAYEGEKAYAGNPIRHRQHRSNLRRLNVVQEKPRRRTRPRRKNPCTQTNRNRHRQHRQNRQHQSHG